MSDLTERIWLCIRLNNAGKWDCDRLTEDADFDKKKVIFSDEAHNSFILPANEYGCV